MKHTPGPWELDAAGWPLIINGPEEGEANVVCCIQADGDDSGASQYHYKPERAEANAKVIKAAPVMHDFISTISRMTFYGDYGSEAGDDAVDTMNNCIRLARKIMKEHEL